MLFPFLATVILFVDAFPVASIILISSPIDGDAGRVTVATPPLQSINSLSPALAVWFVVSCQDGVVDEPDSPES